MTAHSRAERKIPVTQSSVVSRKTLSRQDLVERRLVWTTVRSLRRIPNAVVGADLAARIGVSTGDVFEVLPANESTTRRLRVAGMFRSGLFEYDSTWIYVALDTASAFAGNNHAASVMSVQVTMLTT